MSALMRADHLSHWTSTSHKTRSLGVQFAVELVHVFGEFICYGRDRIPQMFKAKIIWQKQRLYLGGNYKVFLFNFGRL